MMDRKATIWVVGDSTLSHFNDRLYYIPREGYGEQLSSYFNATTYNLAVSGASSKDFTSMEQYRTLLEGSKDVPALGDCEGDCFLVIGFGHNDEKMEEARYTDPNGDYRTAGSFANSLYDNYIWKAIERGVTPVVCTPICRLTPEGTPESYLAESAHITRTETRGKQTFNGGDYPRAILDMAGQLRSSGLYVETIDLTSATIKENLALGEGARWLHCFTGARKDTDGSLVPTGLDLTHTNSYGARLNAWLISRLSERTAPKLHSYSLGLDRPRHEDFFLDAVNSSYKVTEYRTPDAGQMEGSGWPRFTDGDGRIWHGTAFGEIDNPDDLFRNFSSECIDGSIRLSARNNKGKIESNNDGIFLYYTQLPAGTGFTLTARAEVESFFPNDQVSFGLMVRDEVYINRLVAETMGDFVAAGTICQGSIVNFGRKGGKLIGARMDQGLPIEPGLGVDMEIDASNDGYVLSFNGKRDSAGFDYALTGIDSDHIYAGFYVARNCSVIFKDIHLEVHD